MQVAKLFASLGFNVDLTGYNLFEQKLKTVRKETRAYAVSLKTIRTRLNNVSTALDGVNKKLDASKVKASNQRIATSANRLANAVERSAKSLGDVVSQGHRVATTITEINTRLGKGVSGWKYYNKELDEARSKLGLISASIKGIPSHKTITVRTNNVGGGSRGSSSNPYSHGNTAQQAGAMAFLGTGVKDFFRSMTPATALAGGLVTAGFATKEIVERGREMKKMEIIMKSASEEVEGVSTATEHWKESMKYVRGEAHRLGQDVYEMGMGFAKMQQATKGKLNWNDRKTLFTGMAELSTTYGLSGDDQKGVWRALTQMFTKGKIEAEEEGQMAERGLPAKEMIKEATRRSYERQGKDFNDDIYNKLRQKGGLKMQDIAVDLGGVASEIANKNGALNEALQTSLVGQMRLKNAFREASKQIMDGGLDKLLFNLFDGIAKLMPTIKEFILILVSLATTFMNGVSAIKEFISTNPALTAMILGLITLMRLFRFGIFGVASTSLLMAGNFKKAMMIMGSAAKRFLPIALLYGLFKFGEDYKKYLDGEDNWIKTLSLMFEILFLSVSIGFKKMKLAWYDFRDMFKQGDSKGLLDKFLDINPVTKPIKGIVDWIDNKRNNNDIANGTVGRGVYSSQQRLPSTMTANIPVYVDGKFHSQQQSTVPLHVGGLGNTPSR